MRPSIRVGRIAGIDIGIHYSWFAVLALVSWSLGSELFPDRFPGWSAGAYWATGVVGALLLFASVLVHELAHSLVAKARGFPVEGITLFLLGGVSNLKAEARGPRDELVISVVGPLTSLLLAAVFGASLLAFRDSGDTPGASVLFASPATLDNHPAAALAWYLAMVNLLLAVFNLLPAFPLDGGRVLRSVLWAVTGRFSQATAVAARGGQALGLLAIGLGAYQVILGYWGGLWVALIGWFLHSAATSTNRQAAFESEFQGVRVRDVMDAHPATISPDASVSEAVFDHFLNSSTRSLPVCDGSSLVGIITLTDVEAVPREQWNWVKVGERMTAVPLQKVAPEDDLSYALDLLGRHSIQQAPVLEGGRLVGLLSRAHIFVYLHSRRELGVR